MRIQWWFHGNDEAVAVVVVRGVVVMMKYFQNAFCDGKHKVLVLYFSLNVCYKWKNVYQTCLLFFIFLPFLKKRVKETATYDEEQL